MLRALLLSLSVLAAPAFAQCSGSSLIDRLNAADRADLDAAVADMPFSRGILWQAEKDGHIITVAGTMHIHDARLGPIRDRLAPHLQDADLLLLEMTPVEQAAMLSALTDNPSLMFMSDGQTLPDMLDPATWDALSAAASDRNIPPDMAEKLRPWFLMLSLSMPTCAMGYLADGGTGLDNMLMEDADAAGVPMQALEPWDTLFTALEQGTIEEQLDFLAMGVLDADLQQEMFVAMLEGYFAGNVGQVWELSRMSMRFIPGIDAAGADGLFNATQTVLLTDRNAAWLPVIEAASADHDRIMVAVGAAHLPGDDGVLALLQAQGWTITPLD